MNPTRLFVGNVPFQAAEIELQDHFAQAGAVLSCNLMMDRDTGKSRGFAFVEFGSSEEAEKAIEMFHNKEFHGRNLTVNVARPREERAPRRDGGSGGGGGWRGDRGDRRESRDRY